MNEREELTEQQIEAVRIEMGTGVHPSLFLRIARAVEAQVYAALASAPAGVPQDALAGLSETHIRLLVERSKTNFFGSEVLDPVAFAKAVIADARADAREASPPPQATAPADQPQAQVVGWLVDSPTEPDLGHWFSETECEGMRNRPLVFGPTPEVLAALEEMTDLAVRCDSWQSFPREPIERAQAAIAKATTPPPSQPGTAATQGDAA